jgi:hypothetical protein
MGVGAISNVFAAAAPREKRPRLVLLVDEKEKGVRRKEGMELKVEKKRKSPELLLADEYDMALARYNTARENLHDATRDLIWCMKQWVVALDRFLAEDDYESAKRLLKALRNVGEIA